MVASSGTKATDNLRERIKLRFSTYFTKCVKSKHLLCIKKTNNNQTNPQNNPEATQEKQNYIS